MTAFADLAAASAREGTDQLAIARGAGTMRLTVALLIADLVSTADLVTAIDTATGSTVWRSSHTTLRTAVQVRDLLDSLLGTAWRTSGGGGMSGISLDQAVDAAGALLAALPEFSYDATANALTFTPALPAPPSATASTQRYELAVAADGSRSWVPATGAGPVSHADAYIAWSADTAFDEAEFLAGNAVTGAAEGMIPANSQNQYLALWLAGDHWDMITRIDIDHGPNGLTDLEAAVALTVDGEPGSYRRYGTLLVGSVVGGATLRWA